MCPWICGRSGFARTPALPPLPILESGEMLGFAHIPTGTRNQPFFAIRFEERRGGRRHRPTCPNSAPRRRPFGKRRVRYFSQAKNRPVPAHGAAFTGAARRGANPSYRAGTRNGLIRPNKEQAQDRTATGFSEAAMAMNEAAVVWRPVKHSGHSATLKMACSDPGPFSEPGSAETSRPAFITPV